MPHSIKIRVSLPISSDLVEYLNFPDDDYYQIVTNGKGQHYYARETYIEYKDCKYGIESVIWDTAELVKTLLMRNIRIAKIEKLQNEISTIEGMAGFNVVLHL